MSNALDLIHKGFLSAKVPQELVDELFEAYVQVKRRFYRGDLRPNAVEGGRFSEAAFRIIQWALSGGTFTPLARTLPKADALLMSFQNTQGNDSLRLHIPRTLRLIYDIRNKRDVAHLSDGIDPNMQDATLIVHNVDWVLAELVRLYHHVPADEAQRIINELVSREVPVIQEVNGFPRILRNLRASEYCLVLLYWRGAEGATFTELSRWVRPKMRRNLRRTVASLDEKNLLHADGDRLYLLWTGEQAVLDAKLVEPGY